MNEGIQTSKWSSSGEAPRVGGAEESTRTAAEDVDTRRGLDHHNYHLTTERETWCAVSRTS